MTATIKEYRNEEGLLHREDGPALIKEDREEWYLNGVIGRTDGPSVVYYNGDQRWYYNNILHRAGGPAIILADGTEEWYNNGVKVEPTVFTPDVEEIQDMEQGEVVIESSNTTPDVKIRTRKKGKLGIVDEST